MPDWETLTVKQLQSHLKKRGLPISGKKAELIARLEEHSTADGETDYQQGVEMNDTVLADDANTTAVDTSVLDESFLDALKGLKDIGATDVETVAVNDTVEDYDNDFATPAATPAKVRAAPLVQAPAEGHDEFEDSVIYEGDMSLDKTLPSDQVGMNADTDFIDAKEDDTLNMSNISPVKPVESKTSPVTSQKPVLTAPSTVIKQNKPISTDDTSELDLKAHPDNTSIRIDGFAAKTPVARLLEPYLASFGTIQSLYVHPLSLHALVTYSQRAEAEACALGLHGIIFPNRARGNRLICRLCRDTDVIDALSRGDATTNVITQEQFATVPARHMTKQERISTARAHAASFLQPQPLQVSSGVTARTQMSAHQQQQQNQPQQQRVQRHTQPQQLNRQQQHQQQQRVRGQGGRRADEGAEYDGESQDGYVENVFVSEARGEEDEEANRGNYTRYTPSQMNTPPQPHTPSQPRVITTSRSERKVITTSRANKDGKDASGKDVARDAASKSTPSTPASASTPVRGHIVDKAREDRLRAEERFKKTKTEPELFWCTRSDRAVSPSRKEEYDAYAVKYSMVPATHTGAGPTAPAMPVVAPVSAPLLSTPIGSPAARTGATGVGAGVGGVPSHMPPHMQRPGQPPFGDREGLLPPPHTPHGGTHGHLGTPHGMHAAFDGAYAAYHRHPPHPAQTPPRHGPHGSPLLPPGPHDMSAPYGGRMGPDGPRGGMMSPREAGMGLRGREDFASPRSWYDHREGGRDGRRDRDHEFRGERGGREKGRSGRREDSRDDSHAMDMDVDVDVEARERGIGRDHERPERHGNGYGAGDRHGGRDREQGRDVATPRGTAMGARTDGPPRPRDTLTRTPNMHTPAHGQGQGMMPHTPQTPHTPVFGMGGPGMGYPNIPPTGGYGMPIASPVGMGPGMLSPYHPVASPHGSERGRGGRDREGLRESFGGPRDGRARSDRGERDARRDRDRESRGGRGRDSMGPRDFSTPNGRDFQNFQDSRNPRDSYGGGAARDRRDERPSDAWSTPRGGGRDGRTPNQSRGDRSMSTGNQGRTDLRGEHNEGTGSRPRDRDYHTQPRHDYVDDEPEHGEGGARAEYVAAGSEGNGVDKREREEAYEYDDVTTDMNVTVVADNLDNSPSVVDNSAINATPDTTNTGGNTDTGDSATYNSYGDVTGDFTYDDDDELVDYE